MTNRKYLEYIIDSLKKWPGYKEVGKTGESAAFLIVQHSEDIDFQKKCLQLMKKELLTNNINPSHYGYLIDRYLLQVLNCQIFATQVNYDPVSKETTPKQQKCLNVKFVNVLRKYFNMPPLSFYLEQMNKMHKSANNNG